MSTQVRFRRGGTTAHGAFIGAPGEITVNTETHSIHVHDGVTAGGHPTLSATTLNVFTASQIVTPVSVTSSVGTALEIDASQSNNWRISVADDIHIHPPAGLTDGQVLNLLFIHPAAPANQVYAITFDPMFDFGTQPAPEMDVGLSYHFASCYYDEILHTLICTWRQGAAGAGV